MDVRCHKLSGALSFAPTLGQVMQMLRLQCSRGWSRKTMAVLQQCQLRSWKPCFQVSSRISGCPPHLPLFADYGSHDNYARMAEQAFKSWPEVWHDLGRSYYTETGVLTLESYDELHKGESWAAQTAACLERNQDVLPERAEWMDAVDLESRFPYLSKGVYKRGFFSRTGGVLESGTIVGPFLHG